MKVIKSELLFDGRLKGVRYHLENAEGRRYTHETIEHPGAVVILPIDRNGAVVCVSQYRHSLGQDILELPAGTLEKDEPIVECAQRELAEEIGMVAKEIVSLGILYPAPGFCNEVQHLFLARGLVSKTATPDEDEDISVVPLSVCDFEESIRNGKLNDAKSISLFMRARLLGLV